MHRAQSGSEPVSFMLRGAPWGRPRNGETTIDRKLKDETRRRIERELDLREAVLANRRNEN
jgi:hypothetical protein